MRSSSLSSLLHCNLVLCGLHSCEAEIELGEERERWLWSLAWASPTKRAEIMSDGKPGMLESRYRETMDAILCEL